MNTPKQNKFYMPPEWHMHENCWMQWPHENFNINSYGEIPTWSNFDIKKGHITWNGSQFNQEGTVAVPLLGAEGSDREMEYKDIPESPLKELIKQKAVALYADNFRIGKRPCNSC